MWERTKEAIQLILDDAPKKNGISVTALMPILVFGITMAGTKSQSGRMIPFLLKQTKSTLQPGIKAILRLLRLKSAREDGEN